jgi:hypothetical protein
VGPLRDHERPALRFGDFKNRYMNRFAVEATGGGTKNVPVGKHWLSHPNRLTYDAAVFEPGEAKVLPGNRLNLWRGLTLMRRMQQRLSKKSASAMREETRQNSQRSRMSALSAVNGHRSIAAQCV